MSEEEAYKIFGEMTPDVLDYVFCLAKAYTKKDEEIERLKEEYIMLQNASDEVEEEKDKEIERLNNIINELEEEISKHIALCTDITLNDILDKLQELKGSDKEC